MHVGKPHDEEFQIEPVDKLTQEVNKLVEAFFDRLAEVMLYG